ncbi:MAG: heavy metal-binding domain-containing protein [Pseudolabrys sp.]
MTEPHGNTGPFYICPMHPDVIKAAPGKCPYCGMALIPEGSRFGIVRHMMSSPLHAGIMIAALLALMAAAMMLWK